MHEYDLQDIAIPRIFKLSAWEFFCRSSQASTQNNCLSEGPGFCHIKAQ